MPKYNLYHIRLRLEYRCSKTRTTRENIIGHGFCLGGEWNWEKELCEYQKGESENKKMDNKLPKRCKQGCTCLEAQHVVTTAGAGQ